MNFQCFDHIAGAGGFITAIFWQQRRDEPLIKFYQNNQRKGDDFVEHCVAKITN